MADRKDYDARLAALAERIDKVKTEVQKALDELKNTETTPEQDALLARMEASIGGMDDLNPDAETPAPEQA